MIASTLLLVTAMAAPPPNAPVDKSTDRRETAYRRCVGTAARKLSSSPEAAPVVAKSALVACLPKRAAFEDSIVADIATGRPDIPEAQARKIAAKFLTGVDRKFRDYAMYVVTNERSGK